MSAKAPRQPRFQPFGTDRALPTRRWPHLSDRSPASALHVQQRASDTPQPFSQVDFPWRVREEQRSSGIWIGPAAGSTAAQRSAGGKVLPLGSRKLQLVVREPYTPAGRKYRMWNELIEEKGSVTVYSKMDDASLYFDGPYRQLSVRLGDVVRFSVSDEPLTVLGLRARKKA